jgi:putative transposase
MLKYFLKKRRYMAWGEIKVEDQRKKFVDACLADEDTMTEICRQYDISTRSGYKWLNRYKVEGIEGLKDRSRAPHNQALKTEEEIVEEILQVKFKYVRWGPKKILAYLKNLDPDTYWPSTTTIGNILSKKGLTVPRKLRKRVPGRENSLVECNHSNDLWCADFKGWFLTGDGNRCEPFTLTDGATRFLIRCVSLDLNNVDHVWAVLESAFREYGLPNYFRTDNGSPFATCGAGRLSKLSIKLIKAGVTPEWIDPGQPQQNGRHERMHRTLKYETACPPKFTIEEQMMRFKEFINYYNYIRPHEALNQKTPGSIYVPSTRVWKGKLHEPEYEKGFLVRKVRPAGQISLKPFASDIFIGTALVGEHVGLKRVDDDIYEVYYGSIRLGKIDKTRTLILPEGKKRRKINGVILKSG